MQYTNILNLKKPDGRDHYNIDDFNHNSQILDEKIGEMQEQLDKCLTTEDLSGDDIETTINNLILPKISDVTALSDYVDLGLPSGKLWAESPTEYVPILFQPKDSSPILEENYNQEVYNILPTQADFEELINNCIITVTGSYEDGSFQMKITGPNGNSVFYPMLDRYVWKKGNTGFTHDYPQLFIAPTKTVPNQIDAPGTSAMVMSLQFNQTTQTEVSLTTTRPNYDLDADGQVLTDSYMYRVIGCLDSSNLGTQLHKDNTAVHITAAERKSLSNLNEIISEKIKNESRNGIYKPSEIEYTFQLDNGIDIVLTAEDYITFSNQRAGGIRVNDGQGHVYHISKGAGSSVDFLDDDNQVVENHIYSIVENLTEEVTIAEALDNIDDLQDNINLINTKIQNIGDAHTENKVGGINKMFSESSFEFWENNYIVKDGDINKTFELGEIINFSPNTDWTTEVWNHPDQYIKNIKTLSTSYTSGDEDQYEVQVTSDKSNDSYSKAMITYADPSRNNEIVYYIIPKNYDSTFSNILGPFYSGVYGYNGYYDTAVNGNGYLIVGYGNGTTDYGVLYATVINASTGGKVLNTVNTGLSAYRRTYRTISTGRGFVLIGPNTTSKSTSGTTYTQYAVSIVCSKSATSASKYNIVNTGIVCDGGAITSNYDYAQGPVATSTFYYHYKGANGIYYTGSGVQSTDGTITWKYVNCTSSYPITFHFKDSANYISNYNNHLYYITINTGITAIASTKLMAEFDRIAGRGDNFVRCAYIRFDNFDFFCDGEDYRRCLYYGPAQKMLNEKATEMGCDGGMDFNDTAYKNGQLDYVPITRHRHGTSSKRLYEGVLNPENFDIYYYTDNNLLFWDSDCIHWKDKIFYIKGLHPNINGAFSNSTNNNLTLGIVPLYNFSNYINGIKVDEPLSACETYQLLCYSDNGQKAFKVIDRKVK